MLHLRYSTVAQRRSQHLEAGMWKLIIWIILISYNKFNRTSIILIVILSRKSLWRLFKTLTKKPPLPSLCGNQFALKPQEVLYSQKASLILRKHTLSERPWAKFVLGFSYSPAWDISPPKSLQSNPFCSKIEPQGLHHPYVNMVALYWNSVWKLAGTTENTPLKYLFFLN